jgi:hypothetical protein
LGISLSLVLSLAFTAQVPFAHADEESLESEWGEAEEANEAEDQPAAPKQVRGAGVVAGPDAQIAGADADLERIGEELRTVQRHSRAYLGSWFIGQSALISANVYIAMTAESEARRAGFTVAAALSSANFLYLLVQGWPSLGSYKRFKAMPSSTLSEKVAKATYAQNVVAAQKNKDRQVNEIERHIGVFAVATGAGLGIGLGYKDLYEGLSLGVGIAVVGELLILTRPNIYHTPEKRPTFALQNLRLSPWGDKYARGVGVAGRF